MLYILSSRLIYYVTGGLYLLIPFRVGLIYNKHSNQYDLEESSILFLGSWVITPVQYT